MVKRVVTADQVLKALRKAKQRMPFHEEKEVPRLPRDMRQRQLTSIIAGLNFIRAPLVSW